MSGDPFTGEFLVPDDPRFEVDIAQHLVPYHYCAERLAEKRVLEIGCGAGYGANHLASTTGEVHAYDRNQAAIQWARDHYKAPNLRFLVEGVDPGPDAGTYDAVCNFQVLEHLEAPDPQFNRLFEPRAGAYRDVGYRSVADPIRRVGEPENQESGV